MPMPRFTSSHRSSGCADTPMRARRTRAITTTPTPNAPLFSRHIKDLRERFGGKQWWLAYVAGCSDAAVSYWESGKRIPASTTLARIVDALTREGASPGELATLKQSWLAEKIYRREAKVRRQGDRVVVPLELTAPEHRLPKRATSRRASGCSGMRILSRPRKPEVTEQSLLIERQDRRSCVGACKSSGR
jgi:DNA-binding transcriptional regulator YiaG